jgi:hypothetical protein
MNGTEQNRRGVCELRDEQQITPRQRLRAKPFQPQPEDDQMKLNGLLELANEL